MSCELTVVIVSPPWPNPTAKWASFAVTTGINQSAVSSEPLSLQYYAALPTVLSVSPSSGVGGALVNVTGTGIVCGLTQCLIVNMTTVNPTLCTPSWIMCRMPVLQSPHVVGVALMLTGLETVPGSAVQFEYRERSPVVSSVRFDAVQSKVIIDGSDLQLVDRVRVGQISQTLTSFRYLSNTRITAAVTVSTVPCPLRVSVSPSRSVDFLPWPWTVSIVDPPKVSAVTPLAISPVYPATTLTIIGSGFALTSNAVCYFDGQRRSQGIVVSANLISCVAPLANSTLYSPVVLSLTIDGSTVATMGSLSLALTYKTSPPAASASSASFTLSVLVANPSHIVDNGMPAVIQLSSPTYSFSQFPNATRTCRLAFETTSVPAVWISTSLISCNFSSPSNGQWLGHRTLSVLEGQQAVGHATVEVVSAPTVRSVVPSSAPTLTSASTIATITGSGFSPTSVGGCVWKSANQTEIIPVLSMTSTSALCAVPSRAAYPQSMLPRTDTVTLFGVSCCAQTFTFYEAPQVESVTPSFATPLATITLTGYGFGRAKECIFTSLSLSQDISFVSATSMATATSVQCVVPASALAGRYNVGVDTSSDDIVFEVVSPISIRSVSPVGPLSLRGGQPITIYAGASGGFSDVASVRFGLNILSPKVILTTDSYIVCLSPAVQAPMRMSLFLSRQQNAHDWFGAVAGVAVTFTDGYIVSSMVPQILPEEQPGSVTVSVGSISLGPANVVSCLWTNNVSNASWSSVTTTLVSTTAINCSIPALPGNQTWILSLVVDGLRPEYITSGRLAVSIVSRPTLSSITPSSGSPDTLLTITGSGFSPGTSVCVFNGNVHVPLYADGIGSSNTKVQFRVCVPFL